MQEKTTYFGFKKVFQQEKEKLVANVFHSVVDKYDLMNDLMSFGIHRLWKKMVIQVSAIRLGQQVLDVAGGTGDMTANFIKLVGKHGQVVLTDINDSMLQKGRDRLINQGIGDNVKYVRSNAECLPFASNYFDCVCIAFGLRNVTNQSVALSSMFRILKPGGRLLVLEFSKVTEPFIAKFYDFYSDKILPKMGELITGSADSYRYLVESIIMHPDQETLATMMKDTGFVQVNYHNMSAGIVALHVGIKPQDGMLGDI